MAVAQRMIEAKGGSINELFERCEISQAEFSNPNTLLTAVQTNESLNVCHDYSDTCRLTSVQFLKHMHFSDLGALGMAMMNSMDLRQAFDTLLKFQAIYAPTFYIVESKKQGHSILTIQNDVSIGSNNNTVIEIVMGIFSLIKELVQSDHFLLEVSLQHHQPKQWHKDDFSGLKIKWGANSNQVFILNDLMDKKIIGRNQANYTLFENILTQQLKEISNQCPYTKGAEACIDSRLQSGLKVSLEAVSNSLHVSSRTLNRRLNHEGTTFKNLYAQQRLQYAAQLLKRSDMAIKKVASAAGYNALSSFYKAFKAFYHTSPDQYRNTP
jgi:AraC-like DNA-binding protein